MAGRNARRRNRRYGGTYYGGTGGGSGSGGSGRKGGCGCGMITLIILLILAALIGLGYYYSLERGNTNNYITVSTVERKKLASDLCTEIDTWYQDDWGDWLDTASKSEIDAMIRQMKNFYSETGVQPFVWVIGDEGGDIVSVELLEQACERKYDELFTDSGHLLLAISEWPNDSSDYMTDVFTGVSASTVIDNEAKNIMQDYLAMYYEDTSLTEAGMFAKTFESSTDRIMSVTRTTNQMMLTTVIVLLVVVLVIVFLVYRNRKKKLDVESQRIESEQQQFEAGLEKDKTAVKCPHCGATIQVRRGTSGPCEYCGSYVTVDANGNVVS